jgi:hypothetical protein
MSSRIILQQFTELFHPIYQKIEHQKLEKMSYFKNCRSYLFTGIIEVDMSQFIIVRFRCLAISVVPFFEIKRDQGEFFMYCVNFDS